MTDTFIENEDGTFELKMTDDEYAALIFTYVDSKMLPVSKDQFDAVFNTTGDIKEALYAAVINEVVNDALSAFIDKFKAEENE